MKRDLEYHTAARQRRSGSGTSGFAASLSGAVGVAVFTQEQIGTGIS